MLMSRCRDSTTNSPEQPSHGRGLTNYARGNDEDETGFHGPTAPSSSLFGASGGLYIMNDIGNEKDRPATFERRIESTSQISPKKLNQLPRLQNTGPAKELSDMQYVIPPRKVADDLLDLYWDYVDSAYPWLDRPSIENAYEGLWTKDSEQSMNERALHCILNLMFATACVAFQGQPPLSRYQSSIVFFDRAQELMSYELKDLYNFEIIQMLLLTAVYLQHQKSPQKSFRSIGMAIHIAQELGLHIPETTEAMHDPRERDLARRVWNGCVILDRYETSINDSSCIRYISGTNSLPVQDLLHDFRMCTQSPAVHFKARASAVNVKHNGNESHDFYWSCESSLESEILSIILSASSYHRGCIRNLLHTQW